MTAPLPGLDGPGVSLAGGASLVALSRLEAQGRSVAADGVSLASRRAAAFYELTGDLPPTATAWSDTTLANNRYARRSAISSTAWCRLPQVPEWEQIATKVFEHGEQAIRGRQTVDAGARGARQRRERSAREAALAAEQAEAQRKRRAMTCARLRMPAEANTAAWLFLAPALVLICVFFFLPVAASLVLSVTDFDIYAIADPANTRFVGLRQLLPAAPDARFLAGAPEHVLLRVRRRTAHDRRLARRGAPAQLEARSLQGILPHDLLHAVRHDARRSRDRLALPVPHALRPAQLRARRSSASGRSTGSVIRTGRCRRSSSWRCGRTSATTC